MRPHHLQLTAFGPFADTVEVDFDRLGQGGLFLMHGETGAGKTTVLDGLSFALYGRVPGVRGIHRLRSDHASAEVRTQVRLEVSLGGRLLRVTRSPAQERPKRRGQGATVEPASVALDEWDPAIEGGWRPRSTRVGEVDAELSGLLGMSADQFHQVVLLPQGQFAKFLHSDAAERTQLLQRLFGTDRFRRIEDWLADQRRQTKDAYEAAREGVLRIAAQVARVCGEAEPDVVPDPGWVADRLTLAREQAAAATAVAEAARREQELTQVAAAEATDLARRQQRRQGVLVRQRALEAGAARLATSQAEIESARRANAVVPALESEARRARQSAQAHAAWERAGAALPAGLTTASIEQLREVASAGRETLGRLIEGADLERLAAAADREVAAALGVIKSAERRIAELAPLQEQAPVLQAAAEARIAAARQAAFALAAESAAADRTREALAAAQLRAARAAEIQRLSLAHLEAREVAVGLDLALRDLRDQRIEGMIAELAQHLDDDTPCPVCGSLEHPDPSELRGQAIVTKDDEVAAGAASSAAHDRAREIGERLAAARSGHEAAEARLREWGCEHAELPDLEAAVASAAAAVDQLTARAAGLEPAEQEAGRLSAAEATRRAELGSLESRMAVAEQRRVTALEQQRELVARLSELLGDAADVATARLSTLRLVESVEAAASALQAAARADDERLEADSEAQLAAAEAGFASAEKARTAIRDTEALTSLEAEVTRGQQEAAAVAELLADPELAVALTPAAPVETAMAAARQAVALSRQAEQSLATAEHRVRELAELEVKLAGRRSALEPVAAKARQAKELADLAAGIGPNRLNMPLSAYVLAARLEEVAEVASLRLRAMTQGRYTLIHSDASKGNLRSGLRLLVSDAWTGQDRDTATLSGGETFLASLALALGLAEVVTASSGGAPLEALFVDEGFGTLDEDTLDEVLDVLDGLREGGRLVGIVSHVPSLRDRIPSRLRVYKGTAGSTLKQSDDFADGPAPRVALPPPVTAAEPLPSEPERVVSVIEPVAEQLALLG